MQYCSHPGQEALGCVEATSLCHSKRLTLCADYRAQDTRELVFVTEDPKKDPGSHNVKKESFKCTKTKKGGR